MIQYDCDADFWNPIAKGIKIKTLRNMRTKPRRHARPDEPIELWATVGGKRLQILRAQCVAIEGVALHLAHRRQICVGPIFQHRSTWAPLGLGAREQLAIDTGHAGGWKEAAEAYAARYGYEPWAGTLITWAPREYDGPIPSGPQMRDLRVLATSEKPIIPFYGKISSAVGHSLLILGWAEVMDRSASYNTPDGRGLVPIRITDLGRWILERFEK